MPITVKNLTKSFGDKIAVNDLSFEINEPCAFGLIGTNGAGKTTTIRMMLGIMRPDFGSCEWNGKPISRETLSFGYMPEERGIYGKVKVLEQLIYFGVLRGMTESDAKKSALSLSDRLGLDEYLDKFADKLSKGNQQKVQLAATLIHDPELVVLDEPFSGLDPVNAETLRGIISELIERQKYVIMSSHMMSTVEEFCRDIVLLHNGKTVLSGNLREIKAGYGHNRLFVSADGNISEFASKANLKILDERADGAELEIHGKADADKFLTILVENGICPTKYELREPSLNEIFIETAGRKE